MRENSLDVRVTSALNGEVARVVDLVDVLIREMKAAIAEADSVIAAMEKPRAAKPFKRATGCTLASSHR